MRSTLRELVLDFSLVSSPGQGLTSYVLLEHTLVAISMSRTTVPICDGRLECDRLLTTLRKLSVEVELN